MDITFQHALIDYKDVYSAPYSVFKNSDLVQDLTSYFHVAYFYVRLVFLNF